MYVCIYMYNREEMGRGINRTFKINLAITHGMNFAKRFS